MKVGQNPELSVMELEKELREKAPTCRDELANYFRVSFNDIRILPRGRAYGHD
jgi:hypothetical protein